MRRLAVIVLSGLLLAAPAAAQDGGRIVAPARSEAASVSLRGPAGDTPVEREGGQGGGLAALIPVPPPVAPAGATASADSRQCKRTCNRDYYFCLAADEETCAPVWARCTAGCG